jgi:predicted amidophosphoribosyltransferase
MEIDLTPVDMNCMRCGQTVPMRFYGICNDCRAQLREKFDREARIIDVPDYEPKMNVTPNAVALKAD